MDVLVAFLVLFGPPFIVCCIFGAIAAGVASSRNKNGGFWWGFFLGVIGIIVVALRPNDGQKKS